MRGINKSDSHGLNILTVIYCFSLCADGSARAGSTAEHPQTCGYLQDRGEHGKQEGQRGGGRGKQDNVALLSINNQKVPLEIVVWIYDTFDNNFVIKNDLTTYLKESCWLCSK